MCSTILPARERGDLARTAGWQNDQPEAKRGSGHDLGELLRLLRGVDLLDVLRAAYDGSPHEHHGEAGTDEQELRDLEQLRLIVRRCAIGVRVGVREAERCFY